MSDALKVRCPTCDARVGVACRSTAVQYRPGKLYRAHTARVRAAREALVWHIVEAVAHTRACPGVPTEAMAYRVLVRPDGDDGHDRSEPLWLWAADPIGLIDGNEYRIEYASGATFARRVAK